MSQRLKGLYWRKQAETLKAVFDQIPAGILVWDDQGRIVSANLRAEGILRKELGALKGRPLREVVKERDGFMEAVSEISKSSKPVTRRSVVINLEGEPRTIGYSGSPVSDGKSYVLLFQDISHVVSS